MFTFLLQRDAKLNELDKLKSVVKCIEDYKLASEFPMLNVLMLRIRKLERGKSKRKRAGAASASVLEKQQKLQKNSIINHSEITEQADPVTVTRRNTMPKKQSKLPKDTIIKHIQPADPASVSTRDIANLTIAEKVVTSAIPSYQQPLPYAAAPIGPYGMAGSNPDNDTYAASRIGPYATTGSNHGNLSNLYPSGSQLPCETFGKAGFSAGLYEQSEPPMGFTSNIPATGSSLYPSGLQIPSGYYDGNTAYGGYGWAPEYHPSYNP